MYRRVPVGLAPEIAFFVPPRVPWPKAHPADIGGGDFVVKAQVQLLGMARCRDRCMEEVGVKLIAVEDTTPSTPDISLCLPWCHSWFTQTLIMCCFNLRAQAAANRASPGFQMLTFSHAGRAQSAPTRDAGEPVRPVAGHGRLAVPRVGLAHLQVLAIVS